MDKISIKKKAVRIVYIADLHCGSEYAIAVPNLVTKAGRILTLNSRQLWLLENFKDDLKKIGYADILVLMGDLAEGKQVKILSNTLMDADTDTHVNCAVEVISIAIKILNPQCIISVPGTDYHILGTGNLDYQITRLLELKFPQIQFYTEFQTGTLTIQVNDLIHNYAHAYPTTRNTLQPLEQIAREMVWNCKISRKPVPDIFARAHIHMMASGIPRPNTPYGFTTPCQQCKTPYMSQRPYLTVREPDIGILSAEQEGKYFRLLHLSPTHYE